MRRNDVRAILSDFADPARVNEFSDDDDDDGDVSEGETGDGGGDGDAGGDEAGDEDDNDLVEDIEPEEDRDPLKPSPGFASLDDEKSDLLFKIQRFKKQGRFTSKQFSIFSDVRELRAEVSRIRSEIDVEASIKFQRKILMAVVSGLEYGNKRFKVANMHLDGWSEHVHGELDTYDDVFAELHERYKSKVSAPPEIRLLLMVGGSALMYSMSHTMFKMAVDSGRIQSALNQNPQLVQDMATAYAAANAGGGSDDAGAAPAGGAGPSGRGVPRPMRGPGIDLAGVMGMGMGMGAPFGVPPAGAPQPGEADGGGLLGPPVSSRVADRAKVNELFTREKDDEERLSDVISEDLESLDSARSAGSKRKAAGDGDGGARKKVVIIK